MDQPTALPPWLNRQLSGADDAWDYLPPEWASSVHGVLDRLHQPARSAADNQSLLSVWEQLSTEFSAEQLAQTLVALLAYQPGRIRSMAAQAWIAASIPSQKIKMFCSHVTCIAPLIAIVAKEPMWFQITRDVVGQYTIGFWKAPSPGDALGFPTQLLADLGGIVDPRMFLVMSALLEADKDADYLSTNAISTGGKSARPKGVTTGIDPTMSGITGSPKFHMMLEAAPLRILLCIGLFQEMTQLPPLVSSQSVEYARDVIRTCATSLVESRDIFPNLGYLGESILSAVAISLDALRTELDQ
jgi:hypothetical protein